VYKYMPRVQFETYVGEGGRDAARRRWRVERREAVEEELLRRSATDGGEDGRGEAQREQTVARASGPEKHSQHRRVDREEERDPPEREEALQIVIGG
jgi:hypothetical protein